MIRKLLGLLLLMFLLLTARLPLHPADLHCASHSDNLATLK